MEPLEDYVKHAYLLPFCGFSYHYLYDLSGSVEVVSFNEAQFTEFC